MATANTTPVKAGPRERETIIKITAAIDPIKNKFFLLLVYHIIIAIGIIVVKIKKKNNKLSKHKTALDKLL